MQATKYTFNNNIALGADFRINPRNRLSIEAKCILPRLNIKQDLHNTFTDKGNHREENRQNDITWNRENLEASITYTHLFKPEVSDITIKGSVSKIWGHRPSYYSVDGIPTNHSISGGSPFIPALQADYKYKFRRGTLSSGIKLTYRQNDIYHQFYTMSDNDWAYTESLSNDLLHTELIPAAYAMYASRIGKKFSYKIGIRGEFSTVTLNSKHEAIDKQVNSFFLAPSLSATQTIGQNQDLSLAFSRRIGRPSYPQLNPYMSMIDATTYEQGNMYLQPEKSTKVDLSYNYQGANLSLFANGYVNYTNDYISQITKLNDDMLITTYVNADSDLKTGIDILLRITPTKWMNFSIGANTYHVSTKGFYEGAEIDNNGWTNNSNLMLNFLLWKGSDIQMQYFITTPQYFPQLTTALTHQMNIGIKQKLMKGAMTLSLLVTDIMNTARWKVSSHNNLFDLTNISKGKSRMLWLGMSYNFNSFKQKGTQKSETDKNLIKLGM
jgi:outer membrane receptor protein involved in Fe transport